ncbi:oncoprotein-induced transcript 3 protein-like [Watersipora subatra]|uniref:oncoprotein-induced transcript 3 protein-like n=1 Tax=Watersipora subatra TaxID=2589382 RepID=UPI00355C022D
MNTFTNLVTVLVLLGAVNLSMQGALRDRREAGVAKIMKAISGLHSSSTSLRSKREIDQDLAGILRRVVSELFSECFDVQTTEDPLPEGPCSSPNTVNLTGSWRLDNEGSDIQPDGEYNCDAYLFDNTQWFRITGDGGNRIRDSCSPAYSCGSHGGIWTDADMPTDVGETLQVELYGSWSGDCSWYPFEAAYPLTVQRCTSAGDFVYKIDGLTGCYHSVCGMF